MSFKIPSENQVNPIIKSRELTNEYEGLYRQALDVANSYRLNTQPLEAMYQKLLSLFPLSVDDFNFNLTQLEKRNQVAMAGFNDIVTLMKLGVDPKTYFEILDYCFSEYNLRNKDDFSRAMNGLNFGLELIINPNPNAEK